MTVSGDGVLASELLGYITCVVSWYTGVYSALTKASHEVPEISVKGRGSTGTKLSREEDERLRTEVDRIAGDSCLGIASVSALIGDGSGVLR